MTDLLAFENAAAFQEVLREFHVDSLQGWQDVDDVGLCHALLTALAERCGQFIRVEPAKGGDRSLFLDTVERVDGVLTVWARGTGGASDRACVRFRFRRAAVSRFAVVLLGDAEAEQGADGTPQPGVAAVLWHLAFRLTPAHVEEFIRHFS
jgi:hypothetical protein